MLALDGRHRLPREEFIIQVIVVRVVEDLVLRFRLSCKLLHFFQPKNSIALVLDERVAHFVVHADDNLLIANVGKLDCLAEQPSFSFVECGKSHVIWFHYIKRQLL